MSYTDKQITCSDCGTVFTFSAAEQEQFASRGYTNEPKRCQHAVRPENRTRPVAVAIIAEVVGQPRDRCSRQNALPAVKILVPFEPRGDKPVYCSDCYRKTNPTRKY